MAKCLQLLFLVLTSLSAGVISKKAPEPYVVYMGGILEGGDQEASQASHLQMLSSVLPSADKGRLSLVQSYHHAFKGFSAMLTEEEAALLSDNKEVVSVFQDRTLQLHTTRSWDFLEAESGIGAERLQHKASNDVIIGIIDTGTSHRSDQCIISFKLLLNFTPLRKSSIFMEGIWPESPSFSDVGMGEIPSRWKGTFEDYLSKSII